MNRVAGAIPGPAIVRLALSLALCLSLASTFSIPNCGNAAVADSASGRPAHPAPEDLPNDSAASGDSASVRPTAGPSARFVVDSTTAAPTTGAEGMASRSGPAGQRELPHTFRYFNRAIVTFRGWQLGQSPLGRAEAAEARLESLLRRGIDRPVGAQETPGGVLITLGGWGVFTILTDDAHALAGETLDEMRDAAVHQLSLALTERREARRPATLLRGAAFTLAGLLVLVLLLWLTRRASRSAALRLTGIAERLSGRAVVRDLHVISSEQLVLAARSVARGLAWTLYVLLATWWLSFALRQFPFARPWGEAMRGYLLSVARRLLLTVVGYLPELFLLTLIVVATRLLARLVTAFFNAAEQRMIDAPEALRETAQPTRRLCVIFLWVFAVIVAYPYLPGSGTDAFKGVSVFVGLMVSLGSSGVVGQFVSGFVIMYSRALRIGDLVRVGEHEGVVLSVGMLSTKLKTLKREEINIPNTQLLSTTTKNFTRLAGTEGAILYTTVTIGYGTPWRQVHAMLCEAAGRTAGLQVEPSPFVLQTALSDFFVEYQLNAHLIDPQQRVATLAALHANIQDVFNEHGVQIMSPHYEADPAAKVWVPRDRWYAEPASPPGPAAGSRAGEEQRKRHEPK